MGQTVSRNARVRPNGAKNKHPHVITKTSSSIFPSANHFWACFVPSQNAARGTRAALGRFTGATVVPGRLDGDADPEPSELSGDLPLASVTADPSGFATNRSN